MRINRWIYALVVSVFVVSVSASLLIPANSPSYVFADDIDSEYYRVRTVVLDGKSIDEIIISGPPTPPLAYERTTVELPEPDSAMGVNALSNVPAFSWCFGCSATSGAMIAGYYDRTGYGDMYTGPTNGGVMPLDNSPWPDWEDSHGDTRHQCPLSATHDGLDGRATKGHVDDYWDYYGQPGPDPWDGNWAEHIYGDCTGDFMKTNQWVNPSEGWNTDGATTFYNNIWGDPLYDYELEALGTPYTYDGGYGLKLFYESRGYTVTSMYNQYIKGQGLIPNRGFTYAQYKAEIDAGRPVMIHLAGHTVVGLGYDDSTTDLMYIHDTWDYDTHTMTWGDTYVGMQHIGVTIVRLQSLGAQTWYLHNDNVMYREVTNKDEGSVLVGAGGSNIWISDEAATTDVTFASSAWTGQVVFTLAPTGGGSPHTFTVEIGYSTDGDDFTAGGPDATLTGDGSATVFTYSTDAASFTVTNGKYLALRITNNSSSDYTVTTGGVWSYTDSPSDDPGYPVPELATIILLGNGLLALVGYLWFRKRRRLPFINRLL